MSATTFRTELVCSKCNFQAKGETRCWVCGTLWVRPQPHPAQRHAEAQRQAAGRAR